MLAVIKFKNKMKVVGNFKDFLKKLFKHLIKEANELRKTEEDLNKFMEKQEALYFDKKAMDFYYFVLGLKDEKCKRLKEMVSDYIKVIEK